MSKPDLALLHEFKRRAQKALPGRVVRVMEHGQHVQTIAVDSSRSPEHSSFLKNVYEDGIAA